MVDIVLRGAGLGGAIICSSYTLAGGLMYLAGDLVTVLTPVVPGKESGSWVTFVGLGGDT